MGYQRRVHGQLGDCYLIAALSSLAAWQPEWIKNHVFTKWEDSIHGGVYRVNFWVRDRWVAVNFNDDLPVGARGLKDVKRIADQYNENNRIRKRKHKRLIDIPYKLSYQLSGARPSQRQGDTTWWAPLLEKAFAKLYVNYANIIGGGG